MRGYRMYNMYSRDFTGPSYDRLVKKPWEEMYSLDGAANGGRSRAQNDSFLVLHEEVVFFKVYSNLIL